MQGSGGQMGMARPAGQQAPSEVAKPPLRDVWRGTLAINAKQAQKPGGEPMPLFVGLAKLILTTPQPINLSWPPLLVIRKFVSQENLRKYFEALKIDTNNSPKVVFFPTEVKNSNLMLEMSNKNYAAIVDVPPNALILQFKSQNRMVGILLPNAGGNM
uniref:Uncharacterized protein n=1 Tax=Tetraselmis chuii TaxID=63592 RepID=A0A7S1X8F7_9CHLO